MSQHFSHCLMLLTPLAVAACARGGLVEQDTGNDDEPATCAPACEGTTPSCSRNACVCTETSCAPGDYCNADGVCTPIVAARGIGTAIELSESCQITGYDRNGASCIPLEVSSCPDLVGTSVVELRVTAATAPQVGVVIFASGGGGTGFVDTGTLPARLAAAGYTVIDRAWRASWTGGGQGYVAAACRYATALHWIKENLAPEVAFCATGNSGGAAELGYTLGFYGVASLLELVMPTGGPVAARWDYYCHGDSNASWLAECTADLPEGFCTTGLPSCYAAGTPTSGGCSKTDVELYADSVTAPDAVMSFGDTYAHFMQGLNDCGDANVPIGLLFHDAVTSQKSLQFLPNTPHVVTSTVEGQDAFYAAITTHCVP